MFPSPLLYGDILYLVKSNNGILAAINKNDGTTFYGPFRLEGIPEIYASPVGAAGRVHILGRDGSALVLKNAEELTVLARNSLEDGFDAPPQSSTMRCTCEAIGTSIASRRNDARPRLSALAIFERRPLPDSIRLVELGSGVKSVPAEPKRLMPGDAG
jgi:hypothetical protein